MSGQAGASIADDLSPEVRARLDLWLSANMDDWRGLTELSPIGGGRSNPTYRLSDGASSLVLRRRPFGPLLPSAHAVDREFRITAALYPVGFPVPKPVALCLDESVIGSAFYVMDRVEGLALWDGTMPGLPPAQRRQQYEALVRVLASLHSLDYQKLALADYGRLGNYFGRQVQRWTRQYRAAQTEQDPVIDRLIDFLEATVPEQTRTSIIHGDYRLDNVLYRPTSPEIAAVLDWELSTIGDPLADFAYLAMNWVLPVDGQAGLDGADLVALGIPSLDDVIEIYCANSGRERLPDLDWYFSFNMFRLIGIIQGVRKRAQDGNAAADDSEVLAQRLPSLTERAWHHARRAGARS